MTAAGFIVTNSMNPPDSLQIAHFGEGLGLQLVPHVTDDDSTLAFSLEGGESLYIKFVPTPIPGLEDYPTGPTAAEPAELIAAPCHIVVSIVDCPLDAAMTRIILSAASSAVMQATKAVGILLQDGAVFHRGDVFKAMAATAAADGIAPGLLVAEITAAPESEQRVSFLTHGLTLSGRDEEIFLTCPQAGNGGLQFMLQLVSAFLANPALSYPTGDTIGRTPEEKVLVQRQVNPSGEGPPVMRLDLAA